MPRCAAWRISPKPAGPWRWRCPKSPGAPALPPPCGPEVSLTGAIPAGKGMGSSSADIAAAVAAAGLAAGCPLPPVDIARIALSVEPTDGVMFPGIALFDHRRGRIAESLGPPPPMEAIVIDRGGQVDTLAFNAVDRAAQWAAVADRTEAALELVRAGVRRQDAGLIGRGATVSARAGRPAGRRRLGGTGHRAGRGHWPPPASMWPTAERSSASCWTPAAAKSKPAYRRAVAGVRRRGKRAALPGNRRRAYGKPPEKPPLGLLVRLYAVEQILAGVASVRAKTALRPTDYPPVSAIRETFRRYGVISVIAGIQSPQYPPVNRERINLVQGHQGNATGYLEANAVNRKQRTHCLRARYVRLRQTT